MYKVWTEFEKLFIEQHAAILKDEEAAKQLSAISRRNISVNAYRKQRQKMGLRKEAGRGVCELERTKTPESEVS